MKEVQEYLSARMAPDAKVRFLGGAHVFLSREELDKERTMCSPIVQECPVCGEETKTIDKCQWCGTDLAEREEVEQLTDAQVFAITPAEDLW